MSMRKAINVKCRDCIYDDMGDGTWLEQVFQCSMTTCGLYPHRPIPRGRRVKRDLKRVYNFDKKSEKTGGY